MSAPICASCHHVPSERYSDCGDYFAQCYCHCHDVADSAGEQLVQLKAAMRVIAETTHEAGTRAVALQALALVDPRIAKELVA